MRKIPFSPPDLSQAEIDEVIKVLKSGWITTGPETKLFESRIAERCHTEKAVCLSSQTSCAELTLRIHGIHLHGNRINDLPCGRKACYG